MLAYQLATISSVNKMVTGTAAEMLPFQLTHLLLLSLLPRTGHYWTPAVADALRVCLQYEVASLVYSASSALPVRAG